jgi:hypothetical protein
MNVAGGRLDYEARVSPDDVRRYFMDEAYIHEMAMERGRKLACLADDFPSINLYLGTGGHCAYTKACKYAFEPFSIWFEPVMENIFTPIEFDPQSVFYQTAWRIIEYLGEMRSNDYFISNTDTCSSVDALASLRGNAALLMDMLENPEAVQERIAELQSILWRTEEDFSSRICALNDGGTVTNWMHLWSPGRHHQIQCDLSVMISPQLFEKFVLPELCENAVRFGRTVYHLDGMEQLRHLDMILSVKEIDLIQWTPVAGQPETSVYVEELKKIQRAGKGLVLMPSMRELPFLLDELDPRGVFFVLCNMRSMDDAGQVLRLFEKRFARAETNAIAVECEGPPCPAAHTTVIIK